MSDMLLSEIQQRFEELQAALECESERRRMLARVLNTLLADPPPDAAARARLRKCVELNGGSLCF